jgi:hypothetical protein
LYRSNLGTEVREWGQVETVEWSNASYKSQRGDRSHTKGTGQRFTLWGQVSTLRGQVWMTKNAYVQEVRLGCLTYLDPRSPTLVRRRKELAITETLLKDIAKLAIIGLSRRPNTG